MARSRVRLHAGKNEHRSHGQRAHHGQHGEQDTVVVGELLDHTTDGRAEAASELEDGVEHTIERGGGLGKACELEEVGTKTLGGGTRVPQSATTKINTLGIPENGSTHSHKKVSEDLHNRAVNEVRGNYNGIGNGSQNHGNSSGHENPPILLRSQHRYDFRSKEGKERKHSIQTTKVYITLDWVAVRRRLKCLDDKSLKTRQNLGCIESEKHTKE